MTFLLKKCLSLFLMPLPLGLMVMGLGFLLFLLNRAKRTRILCFSGGILCVIFFSIEVNAFYLINRLQSQYQPLLEIPPGTTRIVVLGGGIGGNKALPPNITLNSASLSRLIEGIRLFRLIEKQGNQSVLILSGGRVFQSAITSAGAMRNTAVMLGISQSDIQIENGSKDTLDEAIYLKKMLGNNPFILVTSAYHMPRAMALFEGQGMHPIAAPTQFFNKSALALRGFVPQASGLLMSDIAIHEHLGIWWAKLTHQIR